MSLNLGDVIDDKYRIVSLLGEGGMGAVYEGENVRIHRRVAIKVLHSTVAQSEDAVQRFEREAQAAGRIGSEHIVEVLDLGELPGGDRYMVMEFLDGEALNDRIKNSGRMSAQVTARIVVDMLEGLKAAHSAGIIHRDLKPDNVFLIANKGGKKDFCKIVDFGISKFSTLGGEFSMTRTGAVMGTPYYLSPEQAKGERNVDHRSDLYAVGVILWEAAAGRVPFDGETFNELLFKIVLEPIPPLNTAVPDIDPHFAAIVEKSMARNPDARYQSAVEMQEALKGWLAGQPPAPELFEARTSDVPTGTRLSATPVTAGTVNRTNGNWANTTPTVGTSSGTKKWMIATAALVLLAGGASVYALNSSQAAAEEAAARAEVEAERLAEERRSMEELTRLEAEKAKAEAEQAKAEAARSEAAQATAEAELSASELERRRAEERRAEEEAEAERLAAIRRSTQRPAATPSPAPAPSPAPSGRRIRMDL